MCAKLSAPTAHDAARVLHAPSTLNPEKEKKKKRHTHSRATSQNTKHPPIFRPQARVVASSVVGSPVKTTRSQQQQPAVVLLLCSSSNSSRPASKISLQAGDGARGVGIFFREQLLVHRPAARRRHYTTVAHRGGGGSFIISAESSCCCCWHQHYCRAGGEGERKPESRPRRHHAEVCQQTLRFGCGPLQRFLEHDI